MRAGRRAGSCRGDPMAPAMAAAPASAAARGRTVPRSPCAPSRQRFRSHRRRSRGNGDASLWRLRLWRDLLFQRPLLVLQLHHLAFEVADPLTKIRRRRGALLRHATDHRHELRRHVEAPTGVRELLLARRRVGRGGCEHAGHENKSAGDRTTAGARHERHRARNRWRYASAAPRFTPESSTLPLADGFAAAAAATPALKLPVVTVVNRLLPLSQLT